MDTSACSEHAGIMGVFHCVTMIEYKSTFMNIYGYDRRQFGLHSLRAGGATAAASAGIPDRLFKRHGGWRSETAKDGYVKDSEDARLAVSKGLQL